MLVHIIQLIACKETFKMDIKEILKHHTLKCHYTVSQNNVSPLTSIKSITRIRSYYQIGVNYHKGQLRLMSKLVGGARVSLD